MSKEIWNIVIQGFDRHGTEDHFSVDSFERKEDARKTYMKFLKEDKENPDINVEEDESGIPEYWYTRESGEMSRVKLIHSYLFNENEVEK